MGSSTFGSFEIGRRALHAQQKGVQVTGQNIANANTEGYSRQMVQMRALVPPAVPGVSTPPGYGVAVADIVRVRSEFYGDQLTKALTAQNYWGSLNNTVEGLEVIFQEPGEMGINVHLGEFFDAWQEVSVNPESFAARSSLREQAVSLTKVVGDIYKRMEELKNGVAKELEANLGQINSIAKEIVELNKKITYLNAFGKKSNEMWDQRDLCLQELGKLLDIRVIERPNGALEVWAGGRILLHDDRFFELNSKTNQETKELEIFNELEIKLAVNGGELQGLLESFNRVLPQYQGCLDQMIYHLVNEINNLHRSGYGLNGETGIDFFESWEGKGLDEDNPQGASSYFKVGKDVLGDLDCIAAALEGNAEDPGVQIEIEVGGGEEVDPSSEAGGEGNEAGPGGRVGDGANAHAIANLRGKLIEGFVDGEATFHDYFRGFITNLGVEGRESGRMYLTMSEVANKMREQQEIVSSVSLDDEMLNMIQFQHAYNAISRYLNTFDRMLEALLTELGR